VVFTFSVCNRSREKVAEKTGISKSFSEMQRSAADWFWDKDNSVIVVIKQKRDWDKSILVEGRSER
jgi:hypothetical protein